MSVLIESLMLAGGHIPSHALDNALQKLLVAVRAAPCSRMGLTVANDPTPDDEAHGIVCGNKKNKVELDGVSRRIAQHLCSVSEWVIPATEPDLDLVVQLRRSAGLDPLDFA